MPKNYAVVLAAGGSSRLGQPKAMVPLGNEKVPLIAHLVERLEAHDIESVIVTRQELMVDVMVALTSRRIVLNPDPDAGRTRTLQMGISAILDGIKGKEARILVCPVDRPGFSNSTLTQLLEQSVSSCPSSEGRGGHPLLLVGSDVERVMKGDADQPLRDLLSPQRIDVEDEFLHLNLDTEDDLPKLATWFEETYGI